MPSLKDLKNRIKSVKNTQKITKAQKMVAASKLRRAQEAAEAARPYTQALERMVSNLASGIAEGTPAPALLSGSGKDEVHLVVVATSDRGLCGAFNSSIVRAAKRKIRELTAQGKQVKLLCVGRKGFEQLQQEFGKQIIGKQELKSRKLSYVDAEGIAALIIDKFNLGEFDVVHIVYNKFKSAISQLVTWQQLVPLIRNLESGISNSKDSRFEIQDSPYDYEPEETEILNELLPKNLGIQIFHAMLENAASEQGARMTAMDNATRNAGEMIKKLTIKYNRTRQAAITKELIEIISGAEAV